MTRVLFAVIPASQRVLDCLRQICIVGNPASNPSLYPDLRQFGTMISILPLNGCLVSNKAACIFTIQLSTSKLNKGLRLPFNMLTVTVRYNAQPCACSIFKQVLNYPRSSPIQIPLPRPFQILYLIGSNNIVFRLSTTSISLNDDLTRPLNFAHELTAHSKHQISTALNKTYLCDNKPASPLP